MKKTVRKLVEEDDGVVLKEIGDPNSKWRLLIEYPKGSKSVFEVFQPKNKPYIVVAGGMVVGDDHRRLLDSLGEGKTRIVDSWGMALLFADVLFQFLPGINNLEKIEFAVKIYREELNMPALFRAFMRVEACRKFMILNFRMLESGCPAPPSQMFL